MCSVSFFCISLFQSPFYMAFVTLIPGCYTPDKWQRSIIFFWDFSHALMCHNNYFFFELLIIAISARFHKSLNLHTKTTYHAQEVLAASTNVGNNPSFSMSIWRVYTQSYYPRVQNKMKASFVKAFSSQLKKPTVLLILTTLLPDQHITEKCILKLPLGAPPHLNLCLQTGFCSSFVAYVLLHYGQCMKINQMFYRLSKKTLSPTTSFVSPPLSKISVSPEQPPLPTMDVNFTSTARQWDFKMATFLIG